MNLLDANILLFELLIGAGYCVKLVEGASPISSDQGSSSSLKKWAADGLLKPRFWVWVSGGRARQNDHDRFIDIGSNPPISDSERYVFQLVDRDNLWIKLDPLECIDLSDLKLSDKSLFWRATQPHSDSFVAPLRSSVNMIYSPTVHASPRRKDSRINSGVAYEGRLKTPFVIRDVFLNRSDKLSSRSSFVIQSIIVETFDLGRSDFLVNLRMIPGRSVSATFSHGRPDSMVFASISGDELFQLFSNRTDNLKSNKLTFIDGNIENVVREYEDDDSPVKDISKHSANFTCFINKLVFSSNRISVVFRPETKGAIKRHITCEKSEFSSLCGLNTEQTLEVNHLEALAVQELFSMKQILTSLTIIQ